jgi:aminoglycoside phosphotransferase (APT) family kinase protein
LIDNLPAPITSLLHIRWPGAQIARVTATQGGFSNLTLALDLDDRPLILKAASSLVKRRDLRHEARVLALLRDSPLPVPAVLEVLEDAEWTVELLGRLPGRNALLHLADPIETLLAIYTSLGALLARLHQLPPPAQAGALGSLADQARAAAEQLGALDLAGDLAAPTARGLEWASDPARASRLVHGDPGAHNLLWDWGAGVTALLDWEWAGLGDPLIDIAWVCWTIRFRQLPAQVGAAFLHAYGGPAHVIDERAARHAVLAQIAQILLRVRDLPPARDEWLRRLAWTLALPHLTG